MKSSLVLCILVVAGLASAQVDEIVLDGEVVTEDLDQLDEPQLSEDELRSLELERIKSRNNPEENPDLYQGDIQLTDEQKKALQERKVIVTSANWWPASADGYVYVNYRFALPSINRTMVLQAINAWQANTCIRFTDISAANGKPHIIFQGTDPGCYSKLGMLPNWNGQPVNLGTGCLTLVGTAIHEIGHTMGFYHEQSRSDRDSYVIVMKDNVLESDKISNFDLGITNNFSVPYDYSSVMHYSSTAFAKPGKETLVAKDPFGQLLMGSRSGFSFMDKRIANLQYKCIAVYLRKCGKATDPCKNNGYFGPSCKCECPPGTSGTYCETLTQGYIQAVASTKSPRSRTITTAGTVTSTGYPSPITAVDEYIQLIKAPACKKVRLTFSAFKLYPRYTDNTCIFQKLTIRKNVNPSISSTYCGSEIAVNQVFESEGTTMVLHFQSLITYSYPGYSATITFVPQTTSACTGRK